MMAHGQGRRSIFRIGWGGKSKENFQKNWRALHAKTQKFACGARRKIKNCVFLVAFS